MTTAEPNGGRAEAAPHALVVEDDDLLSQAIALKLREDGFRLIPRSRRRRRSTCWSAAASTC